MSFDFLLSGIRTQVKRQMIGDLRQRCYGYISISAVLRMNSAMPIFG